MFIFFTLFVLDPSTNLEHMKLHRSVFPAGIDMFKVSNRNTRTRCEICSKLRIKTPQQRQRRLYC